MPQCPFQQILQKREKKIYLFFIVKNLNAGILNDARDKYVGSYKSKMWPRTSFMPH